MQRLLREPFLHFLLLGALLFAAYGWLNASGFAARDEILVSRSQVDGLVMQFERVWQRPPTGTEKQALIDGWVRDEVFYREALAMRLEQDDPVVRRRMSQKIQFIVDSGAPAAATDVELQAWLQEHADKYRLEPTYALRQVHFDPSKHGERVESVIAAARRGLEAGRTVSGDPTMLPEQLEGDTTEVARQFGPEFAEGLHALPVGTWQGPVRSAFGVHLVRIERRTEGRAATLAEARPEVARDFMQARTQAANDAAYQRLRAKYAVRIEDGAAPDPAG